jgi:hypothetical protein
MRNNRNQRWEIFAMTDGGRLPLHPSIGHVEKDGPKYRLVPIAWNPVI